MGKFIKEFADECGVSVQSIYQQIRRPANASVLEPYITTKMDTNGRRMTYLEDQACDYLRKRQDQSKRHTSQVVIKDEEIETRLQVLQNKLQEREQEYKREIAELKIQHADRENELTGEIRRLVEEKSEMAAGHMQEISQLKDTMHETDLKLVRAEEQKNSADERNKALSEEVEQLRAELDRERSKGFWKRLFGK